MAMDKRPKRPDYGYDSGAKKTRRQRADRIDYSYDANKTAPTDTGRVGEAGGQAYANTLAGGHAINKGQTVNPVHQNSGNHTPVRLPEKPAEKTRSAVKIENAARMPASNKKTTYDDPFLSSWNLDNKKSQTYNFDAEVGRVTKQPVANKNISENLNTQQGNNKIDDRKNNNEKKSKDKKVVFPSNRAKRVKNEKQPVKKRTEENAVKAKRGKKGKEQNFYFLNARDRKKSRKNLRPVILSALVMVGVIISFFLVFRIESIEVEGDTIYTQEQIIASFSPQIGDNLFLFNDAQVVENMQTALPYLAEVEIKRTIPGRVKITVINSVKTYCAQNQGVWVVFDENLRALEISAEQPVDLTVIEGVTLVSPVALGKSIETESIEQGQALFSVKAALEKSEITPINSIDVEDLLNISMMYNGKIKLIVGSTSEIDDKISFIYELIFEQGEQGVSKNEAATLDVSTKNSSGRMQGVWSSGVS